MDVSIFLAKALGLYLTIISIIYLLRPKLITQVLNKMSDDPAVLCLTAIMTLIVGILLVLTHNIWAANWTIVITILAWLTLLKGIVRLAFPEFIKRKVSKISKH